MFDGVDCDVGAVTSWGNGKLLWGKWSLYMKISPNSACTTGSYSLSEQVILLCGSLCFWSYSRQTRLAYWSYRVSEQVIPLCRCLCVCGGGSAHQQHAEPIQCAFVGVRRRTRPVTQHEWRVACARPAPQTCILWRFARATRQAHHMCSCLVGAGLHLGVAGLHFNVAGWHFGLAGWHPKVAG